jgi:hypothetical protein
MKKIINSIEINDFRSFESETVLLSDVTCLIGANESGKTNFIDALNLSAFSGGPKKAMEHSDIRKNSKRHKENKLPLIKFRISTEIIKNELLKLALDTSSVHEIEVSREGDSFSIGLPQLAENIRIIKNMTQENITIQSNIGPMGPDQDIHTNKKKNSSIHNELPGIEIKPGSIIAITEVNDLYGTDISQKIDSGVIAVTEKSGIENEIKNNLLQEIHKNLNIFFWSYDKGKYSIPDMLKIEEIKPGLDNKPSIRALFKLGGYDKTNIDSILTGQTDTDLENLYSRLSDEITKKIRSKWHSNPNIELKITHKVDHLLINIKEPGYLIEPRFRSEGIRWFLAFIIGIIAEADQLKDFTILIDEPALYLHPGGQKDVLKEINDLAKDNQIVYSTHSHFMIDRNYPYRVKFLQKTISDEYSLTKVHEPDEQDIFRDPLLRSSLFYKISDISYLNEINILVEGFFDSKVITCVNQWCIENTITSEVIDMNNTATIPCDGAFEIVKSAKHYIGNELICLSIYDSDQLGSQAYKQNTTQTKNEKIEIGEIVATKNCTMEDLIPELVFMKAFEAWSGKSLKSIPIPRMKAVNTEILEKITALGIKGEDEEHTRRELKHDLEDKIIDNLTTFLEQNHSVIEELNGLLKLQNLIVKKISGLIQKTKVEESKQ